MFDFGIFLYFFNLYFKLIIIKYKKIIVKRVGPNNYNGSATVNQSEVETVQDQLQDGWIVREEDSKLGSWLMQFQTMYKYPVLENVS